MQNGPFEDVFFYWKRELSITMLVYRRVMFFWCCQEGAVIMITLAEWTSHLKPVSTCLIRNQSTPLKSNKEPKNSKIINVWKMIFLVNWLIFRFHVNFQGHREGVNEFLSKFTMVPKMSKHIYLTVSATAIGIGPNHDTLHPSPQVRVQ